MLGGFWRGNVAPRMLRDVVAVQALPKHRLGVRFDDGTEGVADVAQMVEFTGVFKLLRDPEFFAKAGINMELGTVCWPNHADLHSDVLFAKIAAFRSGVRPGVTTCLSAQGRICDTRKASGTYRDRPSGMSRKAGHRGLTHVRHLVLHVSYGTYRSVGGNSPARTPEAVTGRLLGSRT